MSFQPSPTPNTHPTDARPHPVLLLLLAVLLLSQSFLHFFSYQDDAFIFFRYVDNLLQHGQLVFNLNERIEGFTSPLWILLLSLSGLLGLSPLYTAGMMGILFTFGSLVLSAQDAKRSALPFPFSWLAPLGLALCFHYVCWAVSGMETALFSCLLWGAIASYRASMLRGELPGWHAGILFALAALARPEGGLAVIIFCTHGVWLARCNAPDQTRKTLLALLGPAALCGILLSIARWSYYGSLLPNTFHAKHGGSLQHARLGLAYTWDFLLATPVLWLLPLLLLAFIRPKTPATHTHNTHPPGAAALTPCLALLGCYVLYFLRIGGDYFPYHRFWVPLLPLLFALAAAGLTQLHLILQRLFKHPTRTSAQTNASDETPAPQGRLQRWLLVALFALLAFFQKDPAQFHLHRGFAWTIGCAKLGLALEKTLPPKALIATPHIGAIGYYAQRPVLDLLGLTDRSLTRRPTQFPTQQRMQRADIGHDHFDIAFSMRRKPHIVLFTRAHSSRPFTHHSEIPTQFAAEERLLAYLRQHKQLYTLKNIQVAPRGYWAVFVRTAPR